MGLKLFHIIRSPLDSMCPYTTFDNSSRYGKLDHEAMLCQIRACLDAGGPWPSHTRAGVRGGQARRARKAPGDRLGSRGSVRPGAAGSDRLRTHGGVADSFCGPCSVPWRGLADSSASASKGTFRSGLARFICKYRRSKMNICAEEFGTYIREGEKAALALPNRGPMQLDSNGNVAPEILEGYARYGFYVLENFLGQKDLQDWQDDLDAMKANYPVTSDAEVDLYGRTALGIDAKGPALFWARPLSDPLGGTQLSGGRYAVRMSEPLADESLPDEIVYMIMGPLRYSDALLRITGHPHLLAIAEAVLAMISCHLMRHYG